MITVSVEVADDQLHVDDDAIKSLATKVLTEGGQTEGDLTIIFSAMRITRSRERTP